MNEWRLQCNAFYLYFMSGLAAGVYKIIIVHILWEVVEVIGVGM